MERRTDEDHNSDSDIADRADRFTWHPGDIVITERPGPDPDALVEQAPDGENGATH